MRAAVLAALGVATTRGVAATCPNGVVGNGLEYVSDPNDCINGQGAIDLYILYASGNTDNSNFKCNVGNVNGYCVNIFYAGVTRRTYAARCP